MEKWRTEGWPSVAEWRKAVERHRRACSKARAEQRELPPPPEPPALGLPPTQPAELALAELPSNTITGSEGHAGDRCRSIVKRSTTASRAFDKPWSELAENERAAVQRLGFDATTWDTVVGAEPSTAWLLLPSEQREAAITIGYSQERWDADVPPEPFVLKPWVALSKAEQCAAIALGHHRRSWGEHVPDMYQWEWPDHPGPYSIVPDALALGHDKESWNAHRRAAELWYLGRTVQFFKIAGDSAVAVGHEVVETAMESEGRLIHTVERMTEDGEHLRAHFMTSASDGPRTEAERQAKTRALRKLYPARDAEFKAKDSQRHSRKRQRRAQQQQQAQQDLEDLYGSDGELWELPPLTAQGLAAARGDSSNESSDENSDESGDESSDEASDGSSESGDESEGGEKTGGWKEYSERERQLADAELFGTEQQLSPDLQAELERRHSMKLAYNDRMRRSRFLPEFLDVCGGMEFNNSKTGNYGDLPDVSALDRDLRLHGYGVYWDRNYYTGLTHTPQPPPIEQRFWLTEGELNDPVLRAQRLADMQPHMQFRSRGGCCIRRAGRCVCEPVCCSCSVCVWERVWGRQIDSGEALRAQCEDRERRRIERGDPSHAEVMRRAERKCFLFNGIVCRE